MKKIHILLATLVFTLALSANLHVAKAAIIINAPTPVTGWAWSSNTGYINFNPAGSGVTLNTNGNLTGWAWSSNVGWVSFNAADLTGCTAPSPAAARVNLNDGTVTGWIRVVAGKDATAGGWDGCVSLSGTGYQTGSGLGVTLVNNGVGMAKFVGYAWGGAVMGWIRFDPNIGTTCNTTNNVCVPTGDPTVSGTCSATPTSLSAAGNVTFTITATGGTSPYTYDWPTGTTAINSSVRSYSTSGGSFSVPIHDSDAFSGSALCPAITVNNIPPDGGGAAASAVYIGSSVPEIDAALVNFKKVPPTGQAPTYLEVKAGDPVSLEWEAPAGGYTCTKTFTTTATTPGNIPSAWTGTTPAGALNGSVSNIDTSASSKGTYTFGLDCSGTDGDGKPLPTVTNTTSDLLIYFSTVGEK